MKQLAKLTTILMLLLVGAGFTACSDDEDENNSSIPSELYGTWYGERIIQTTGTVCTITLTFNQDGTGRFEYTSSVYYRVAQFRYSMNGSTISCEGVIANQDGEVNKFQQQFAYHSSYITPIGAYSDFKLTK